MNKQSRILVVDDEAINVRILVETLSENINYSIIATIEPTEGLELAKSIDNKPDLILLDINMPKIDGYQFCKEIKKNPYTKNIPIIFITGLQDSKSEALGIELGGVDYITKPFTQEVVRARVKNQLELKHLKDALSKDVVEKTEKLHRSQEDLEKEQTIRGQLEEKLQRASKMETIGTMTSKIAHDFNNILLPINCYTEMAMGEIKNPEINNNLQQVLKAVERAKDLISQIRSMGRSTTITEQNITRNFINIQNIIDEVKMMLTPTLPENISIVVDYNDKGTIIGNTTQIHQVIMNLSQNAIHAMEQTGGVLSYKVTIETVDLEASKVLGLEEDQYMHLKVKDTGSGIEEQYMHKIFDPFFTTKGATKGTGLGLSITHGIIQSHRGDIFVKSKLGKGTTFDIFLPVLQKEEIKLIKEKEAKNVK